MDCKALSEEKRSELKKRYEGLNDAHITRKINELQHRLLAIVVDKDMVEFINEMAE
jgi:predicted ATP-grasp superfamily ATP-dependent carboligase